MIKTKYDQIISWLYVILQLVACTAAIHFLQFESVKFADAFLIFIAGGMASWLFEGTKKSWMLTITTLVGLFFIFPSIWAVNIVLMMALVIGLLVSPLSYRPKTAAFIVVVAGFLCCRLGGPWSKSAQILVPVFGAIFSVRVFTFIKYFYSSKKSFSIKDAVAYFFILPNFVMFFFPIIDFARFIKGAKESRDLESTQAAVVNILNGVLHLFLYRLIQVTIDMPLQSVSTYGDFFQHLVVTYFYYLRISGSFHLLVGALGLYGISLPRAHNLYFFARNSQDVFQRINIYWKDFMWVYVYRPVKEFINGWGMKASVIGALVAVFVVSCVVHSLFYLWPTGHFKLRFQDILFWLVFGILTGIDIFTAKRRYANDQQALRQGTYLRRIAFQIMQTFFLISFFWAIWVSSDINDFLAAPFLIQWTGFSDLLPLLVYPVIGIVGAWYLIRVEPWFERGSTKQNYFFRTLPYAGLLTFLIFLPQKEFRQKFPESWHIALRNLADPTFLTEFEAEKRENDYYEGFKSSSIPVDEDEAPSLQPLYFQNLADYRRREFLPNLDTVFRGHRFVTNQYGMPNSQNMSKEKTPGVIRIALLGASNSMAYGIDPDRDWVKQAADLINSAGKFRVEILNFSVIGYSSMLMPEVFRKRVIPFKPDILVHTSASREFYMNGFNTSWALRNGLEFPFPELLEQAKLPPQNSYWAKHSLITLPFPQQVAIYNWGEQKLADMAKAADPHLGRMFYFLPTIYEATPLQKEHTRYNEAHILEKARASGFQVIDRSQVFAGEDLYKISLADDVQNFNHFSQLGHDRMARIFAADLVTFIQNWQKDKEVLHE